MNSYLVSLFENEDEPYKIEADDPVDAAEKYAEILYNDDPLDSLTNLIVYVRHVDRPTKVIRVEVDVDWSPSFHGYVEKT